MTSQAVKQFEESLKVLGSDYLVTNRDGDQACEIKFIGTFNDSPVVWHASIQTLKHYVDQLREANKEPGVVKLQQFLEIEPIKEFFRIDIGLNLAKIDEAAIKRAIIMIRKYKRLHIGRHEYGEFVEF